MASLHITKLEVCLSRGHNGLDALLQEPLQFLRVPQPGPQEEVSQEPQLPQQLFQQRIQVGAMSFTVKNMHTKKGIFSY